MPALALLLALLPGGAPLAEEVELKVGDLAPGFTLVDQNGVARNLSEYRGEWVVLYFYPKDDTPGCTTEACNFRDDYFALRERGARVLGVSVDSAESHAAFAEKYGLPFPLLADTGHVVTNAYGTLGGIWPLRLARRETFIIDPQGHIAKVYRSVKAKTHSREVIADLDALQAETN